MKLLKKLSPKALKMLFGLVAFGCVGILILSYFHPKKTLNASQTLSSLNERKYVSDLVDDTTKLDLFIRAYDISAEYIGLFMATDTRVLTEGMIHYNLIKETSGESVTSGDLSLAGTGNNSFLLLPFSLREPLDGDYHLLLTFSDIDPYNAPAFWITTNKYENFVSSRDGVETTGNLVAILYTYGLSRPLIWDSIFILLVLGTVFVLLPKNGTIPKEDK